MQKMAATTDQTENGAPYAEQTALTDLFGDHPKTKILAVLTAESRDINITRLAELAGSSRSTIYDHIEDLQELGVVEQTRKVGGSPLYQINKDSDVAKKLAQLEWDLVEEYDD
jgi:DNA-binding transcriptional ArsR family regulator